MPKLIVVIGLPGSGKSHYVHELRGSCQGVCAEDYMASSHNNSSRFTDSRHYADLIRDLRDGKDCVIADIEYCDTWRRVEVEEVVARDVPGVTIEWHCFENNPTQCNANVDSRNRKNAEEEKKKVRHLSQKYQIPFCAKVIPVWTPFYFLFVSFCFGIGH
jgi:predicted kinase